MIERVRLPRKLTKSVSGGTLAEAGRLHPVGSLNITMNLQPLHRVTMTLAENDLDLAMHDLVEVYNQNGSVGVYRVTKITNTLRKERKIELSHGLDVFSDATLACIEDWNGSVKQFLQMIVDAQTQKIGGQFYWQLGQCDDTEYWEKDIKYDNAMSCLTEIAKTEEDYMFTFDQSTFPWTLNFISRNATVLSEFRLRRNTESCVITLDDSDLCTRLYLSVSSENEDDEGAGTYFDEGYYTFNDTAAQAIYGIVCKTAGIDQSVFSPTVDLEAWKDAYFARHNTPNVQITIDGMELNRITGDSYDEMHLGRICQVALPDYNATYAERIVSVNYPDALRKPNYIRVSLHNKRETAEDAFAEISSTASSAASTAKSSGRSSHNDATYFRRTIGDTANGLYSRIEQTAYYIRAEVLDTANGLYSRIEETASYIRAEVADTANGLYSKIEETASYIRSEVSNTTNGLYSRIEQTASEIRSEVSNTANGLNSKIDQTASYIRSEVSQTAIGLSSRIDQNASQIALRVVKGDVATQLAVECGNVSITGGNLVVDGYVTAAGLSSAIGDIATLMVQDINGASAVFEGDVGADGLYVSTIELNGYQVNIVDAELSVDGKSLIISKADGTSVTFSKATTLSPSWSGSTLTISAQQTNGGSTSTVATHLVELGGNYTSGRTTLEFVNDGQAPSVVTMLGAKTLTVPLKVRSLNSGSTAPTDRLNTSISCNPATVLESKTGTSKITANGTYYPGTNYIGFSAVEVDVQGGTVNTGLVIDTTNHEIRTSTSSTTQTVAIESTISLNYSSATHKYIANGSALANGNTIHEATGIVSGNQAYNAGWGDAYADVSLPTTNTSDNFTVTTPSNTVGGTAVSTTYTISNSTDNMVQVKSGSGTVVGRFTHGKYNAGFDAVGSPTITWPSTITTGTREDNISIKASVAAKTTGTARSTTMHLSIGQSTFTTSGGITGYPCVNLYSEANQSGNIIGRSDCGAIHNNGGKTAWLYRQSGSSWVKVTKNTTLGFGQTLRVRYTAANKNVANVTDALFYSPTLNLQSKDITTATTTTIEPDSGYDGLSSVIVRPAHQSYFTLTRGTKIQDNVYQYTVTLGSNVTGNAQSFTVYY